MNIAQLTALFYTLISAATLVGKFFAFEKMGIEGYKSFIPLVSDHVLFVRFGERKRFWLFAPAAVLMVISFAAALILSFGALAADDVDWSDSLLAGCLVCAVFSLIMMITVIVTRIPVCQKLAASFGRDAVEGIGFLLAPAVFWPLAAGRFSYADPNGEENCTE
ncbi:MAG: hypothetical protein IJM79_05920 [Erysipelotrichaceae bacterium]|nr:hypothetical protein [Erysipelotrichaceae bacterium]